MAGLFGGSGASAALSPVHIPAPFDSVFFNTVPIVVLLYGFWDEYSVSGKICESKKGNNSLRSDRQS